MQCKFLKLSNGDDIIAQIDAESVFDKDFISLTEPVQISSMKFPRGNMIIETYVMQPWIKVASVDIVEIPTKDIIAAVDIQELAEKQYYQYVEESKAKKQISDAPLSFGESSFDSDEELEDDEDVFDEFLDLINSEEDDDGIPRTRTGTTIH